MIRLELLSKYRTQLMGLAILAVMFFHSSYPVPYFSVLGFLKNSGYAGVEIFFLLSGFGIYFAINKTQSILQFYKKRVLRILPYYLPIVLLFSIMCVSVDYWTVKDLFYSISMIGFWINHGYTKIFDWYIPALLFMYLITPIFFNVYKKNKKISLLLFCSVPLLLILCNSWIVNLNIEYLYLFLYRIPLYFIGFAIADFLSRNREYTFSISNVIFGIFMFFVGLIPLLYYYFSTPVWDVFTKYGRQMFFCFILIIPFCLLFSYLLSRCKNYQFPILTFLGTYTLTIYIFHERILKINQFLFGRIVGDNTFYLIIFNTVVIAVTVLLAFLWQKFIDKVMHKIIK